MTDAADIAAMDLAALIASRVCHDIISPVGAIENGLEVMGDDSSNDEMKAFALDLIKKSARQASAKLQFARIAFGAAGSAGAEIDLGDAEKVARGFLANEKPDLSWEAPRALMPKNRVKLLLNLLLMSLGAIPRGGKIHVAVTGEVAQPTFTITCIGPSPRVPANAEALLAGTLDGHAADAHVIQPVYTGLLARAARMTASIEKTEEAVIFRAVAVA
jgi:histidine phosphotransferase ChpT